MLLFIFYYLEIHNTFYPLCLDGRKSEVNLFTIRGVNMNRSHKKSYRKDYSYSPIIQSNEQTVGKKSDLHYNVNTHINSISNKLLYNKVSVLGQHWLFCICCFTPLYKISYTSTHFHVRNSYGFIASHVGSPAVIQYDGKRVYLFIQKLISSLFLFFTYFFYRLLG